MTPLLTRVVDYFVPDKLKVEAALNYRPQLFIVASLGLIAVILGVEVYTLLFSALAANDILWTLAFTVPLQLVFIFALLFLRIKGEFSKAVTIVLVALFLTLSCAVYFLGGPLGGIAVLMSLVQPLFAFVLLGFRPGLLWACATYVLLMVGSIMDVAGYQFPYIDNTPHAGVGKIIHLNVAYVSLFVIVTFYEITNQRYRLELQAAAQRDDLTDLPNRSGFYQEVETAIAHFKETRTPFTLLYIDLDNFKQINDQYGHGAGDQVLQAFARRLQASVRRQDFVCRLGGDEFAVLLRDSIDTRIAQLVLDRLEKHMLKAVSLRNGKSIAIEASIGMAFYPHDAASLEEILHAADERMYDSKRKNKDVPAEAASV